MTPFSRIGLYKLIGICIPRYIQGVSEMTVRSLAQISCARRRRSRQTHLYPKLFDIAFAER